MTTPERLLIIADAGGEATRHIGDEAMLEANLAAFRRLLPRTAITVISRDPAWTAGRYGVASIAPPPFPRGAAASAERQAVLERLLADAAAGRRDSAMLDAIARTDAVVISGGGNLASTWPDLLYERAALLLLAERLGKPSVVLGQTLGPHLTDDERQLLAAALASARFVGVRELPSAALALALGVRAERIWYQADDALLLDDGESRPPPSLAQPLPIAVTIDPQLRAAGQLIYDAFVAQLRALVAATGAPLLLIPHEFGSEAAGGRSDRTEAELLAERVGAAGTEIAANLDAAQTRRLTAGAALVISSRYHPIVFGLSTAVPAIALFADDYCRIKVQGALAHAGLERYALSFQEVAGGALLETARALWQLRVPVGAALRSQRALWIEESRQRWSAVLRALDPEAPLPAVDPATLFGRPVAEVAPALAGALAAAAVSREQLRLRFEESDRAIRWLQSERGIYPALRRTAASLLRQPAAALRLRRPRLRQQ
jgi:polysaccharide pyruvyl transferase WcaK-like protein